MCSRECTFTFCLVLALCALTEQAGGQDVPDPALTPWLQPQTWVRDVSEPVVSLGEEGDFDDTHIFAPAVVKTEGGYLLWYCGSRGAVADRIFKLGLATSADGRQFTKHENAPVLAFPDGRHSILTPAVLDENGTYRMWFAATDFTDPSGLHTLHESTSDGGVHWTPPSEPLMENVYAPTILHDGGSYRMWYVDVSSEPWIIRHAESPDGRAWTTTPAPCIVIDQLWEERRLFYPAVRKSGGVYLMWYGSYWTGRPDTTALGFAVSRDGLTWYKHPGNPVFTPDPGRWWESHYTTSQSLVQDEDGSWRMWYATRKAPPFENKYFAIGTARWKGPGHNEQRETWLKRADSLREQVRGILTLPEDRVDPAPEIYGRIQGEGYTVEKVTYASEPGSRVSASLYLPQADGPVPGLVLACGHGGSKSGFYAQYGGQLYAKMGFACLVPDTIGEEERNIEGRMGSRAHDLYRLNHEERLAFVRDELQRSILGKIVLDLQCGLDYLQSRSDVEGDRLGVMGYSLGGTSAGCLSLIDSRVKAALICGWGHTWLGKNRGKDCSRLPYMAFSDIMSFDELNALAAPHAAVLYFSGDHDSVIDLNENGAGLVRQIRANLAGARRICADAGVPVILESRFQPGADHRPLFLTHPSVMWFQEHLQTREERREIPIGTVAFGDWVDGFGQQIEELYNTEARKRGTAAVDIGAVYRTPGELACFPGAEPTDEYTFEGWLRTVIALREPE